MSELAKSTHNLILNITRAFICIITTLFELDSILLRFFSFLYNRQSWLFCTIFKTIFCCPPFIQHLFNCVSAFLLDPNQNAILLWALIFFFYWFHIRRDSIKVGVSEPGKTYIWKEQGYTSCSASCLGGVEELIINCVREDNGKVASPFLCSPETKPEARIRTCNDRPCPPRWNYSDYSPCSKSCGIGIREREVSVEDN